MVQFPVAKLNDFFALIAKNSDVYLPVTNKRTNEAEFSKWTTGVELSDKLNTVRSAKDFFFPQTENMAEFKMEGKSIEVIDIRKEHNDFVVFGVRACDAASFLILDSVYLADPVDTYYKDRREHGTVITLACSETKPTCFCKLFNIDPANPAGDASAWITNSTVFIEANTEKGEKLLALLSDFAQNAQPSSVDTYKKEIAAVMEKQPFAHVNMEKFKGENLLELFNSPKWAHLSQSCLGCGTCTFVCPTCQCYDIRDFDTGHGIKRFRCWDSCMYSDFTKMAHGNPRLTQLERFRQRFMHKLVYHPDNHEGTYGCVGCGRCLAKCPISMNIVKVMKELGEDA